MSLHVARAQKKIIIVIITIVVIIIFIITAVKTSDLNKLQISQES
jgi:hypothetical protein